MTGKHFQWHKRWTVDLETGTATHHTGFVAAFVRLPLSEEQKAESDAGGISAIGQCWMPDGRQFGIVTTMAMLDATFGQLSAKHGAGNAQQMIARLGREAGEAFEYAQRRHRH
jgi:hypothetical protein